jgi:hypothetical protein
MADDKIITVTTGLIAGSATGAAITGPMKSVGYAIYDVPPRLKAFLEARASGNASKELMMQLSADAMAEQEREKSRRPRTLDEVVIEFQRARRDLR